VVLEGDEYDTAFFDKRSKFLHYLPELVVVNNIEFDHADIYDSLDEIKLTFRRLLNVVPGKGLALVNGDDANCREVAEGAPCPVEMIGFGTECGTRIGNVGYDEDGSRFELRGESYFVPMVGEFNVRNAAMSVMAGLFAGLTPEQVREGLRSFDGIARRQELRGEARGVKVIDDFAHHPTAIKQAVEGLRQRYRDGRLWVVFEPRSNTTRRNIFQDELAEALAAADLAVVPQVPDPEKVALEERLDPEKLIADVKAQGCEAWYLATVDDIVEHVAAEAREGDVVAVLSNGGFGGLHTKLLEKLGEIQD
jgi:UDP-N-acetylmuramate: L-alanyl-gamma-D-glutamyl-meso-diaminopimelate ligase